MRQTPAALRKSPFVAQGGTRSKSPSHRRMNSDQFIVPEENLNVSWLEGRGTWAAYVLMLLGARFLMSFLPISNHSQWTATNAFHAVINYMAFHYNTGIPWTETSMMQGKYEPMTFWQSLDLQYDHHKRFLIIMPVILFIITINTDQYPPSVGKLALNLIALSIVLVPKLLRKDAKK